MKLDQESFYRWIDYIGKTMYKIMCTWLGPLYPIVRIHHPDPLRKIRKCPKDEFLMNLLATVTGDGFLTLTADPKWQRNRRLLTPAFHYNILKSYIAVYNSCIEVSYCTLDGCSKQETACQSG